MTRPLQITIDIPQWADPAVIGCNPGNAHLFFPEQHDQVTAAKAKRICQGCPLREQCLDWVLDHPIETGIVAGLGRKGRLKERLARLGAPGSGNPETQPSPSTLSLAAAPESRKPRRPATDFCGPAGQGPHKRTPLNTRVLKDGSVRCRDCNRDKCTRYRQRRQEAA